MRELGEVEDFEAGGCGVEVKTDESGDAVEARATGGTGVDVEEVVVVVVHDFEDVAVAADKDVGTRQSEGALQGWRIVAGPAADVHHEYAEAFDFEEELLFEFIMKGEAVAVAPDGTDGFPGAELVEDAWADVAGVPEFVAVAEEGVDLRGDVAVGVAKDSDAFHVWLFVGVDFLEVFGDHFLEVVDDMDVVEGHAVEGFVEFVGVEDEGVVVGGVGDEEMDVLVCG